MKIYKQFTFEAAHRLPNVPEGHKCARLHGHSFHVEIHVSGPIGADTGWVMDFADLKTAFAPLHRVLDHNYLNDIPGLENPTSEHIARWILGSPSAHAAQPLADRRARTCTSGAIYEGR